MKKINQILRKYFEPAFLDKVTSLKIITHGICDVFLDRIFVLLFVPVIVELLSQNKTNEALLYSSVALGLFLFFFFLRSRYMYYWFFAMDIKYNKAIFAKYIPVTLEIDPNTFEKNGVGYHLSKFNSGVRALSNNTREILFNVPGTLLLVISSSYLIFHINLYLGVVFLAVLFLCIVLASWLFGEEVRRLEPEAEMINLLQGSVARLIMSKSEVLYSNKVKQETEDVVDQAERVFKLEKNAFRYSLPRMGAIWYLPIFTLLVLLTLQSFDLFNLSVSELTLLVLLSSALTDSFTSIFRVIGGTFENVNSINAFWDMINEEKIKNYNSGEIFEHKNGEIKIESISFSYSDDVKVLNNFNLHIQPKERVALVGRSGSGKSTIAKLVTAYMHPDQGKILVDGQDLSKVMIKSYYKYIGYLTQDPMVFDGTVKENLLYSVSDKVSNEQMLAALSKAECSFIINSKDGLETKIGERGVRLSGGEKQRLAIAKLFLKNPEIIILDEPTSALDSFSEDLITKALDELFKERTVIIIAHRLQTVKKADRIIVMEKGQIVEEGNHENLIAKNGTYSKMLELQAGI